MTDEIRLECLKLAFKHGRNKPQEAADLYIQWVGSDALRLACLRAVSNRSSDVAFPNGVLYQAADTYNYVKGIKPSPAKRQAAPKPTATGGKRPRGRPRKSTN